MLTLTNPLFYIKINNVETKYEKFVNWKENFYDLFVLGRKYKFY